MKALEIYLYLNTYRHLWEYYSVKKEGKKRNYLESYSELNVQHFSQKWPNYFPDIELVFVEIENGNEEFSPGAPCNERNYFNK